MNITNQGNHLIIEFSLVEKTLGLHGNFKIQQSSIVSIEEREPEWGWLDLKIPGTFFPGLIRAGTYYSRRGKEFWYWTNKKHTYVIELKNMPYKRIILSTDDTIKG
jgi:hypothetical protein